MKTVSEIGELCDAIIKNRTDDIKDAVGDTAVCLVNFAKMVNYDLLNKSNFICDFSDCNVIHIEEEIGFLLLYTGYISHDLSRPIDIKIDLERIIGYLKRICVLLKIDLTECCNLAWNQTKDRKGKMVEGGAFITEGDV